MMGDLGADAAENLVATRRHSTKAKIRRSGELEWIGCVIGEVILCTCEVVPPCKFEANPSSGFSVSSNKCVICGMSLSPRKSNQACNSPERKSDSRMWKSPFGVYLNFWFGVIGSEE